MVRHVITRAELEHLGVSQAMLARYIMDAVLQPAGDGVYERTAELDRRLGERCNVGRGYLLAVGVTPATIANTRLVSYTLESEPGTSLRAAGWRMAAEVRGRSWNCPSRPRRAEPSAGKRRWEAPLGAGLDKRQGAP